jgi:hypothetical protein
VARRCSASPAVFCYDLMNEPVVPGARRKAGDWLGPPFAGKHFVQFISLDPAGRARPEVARAWIRMLAAEVRRADPGRLVTVGLVDWSLDRPGLTSGFVPARIAADLDFLCVHLYPERGKVDEALKTLAGFSVGKSVVVEETFPLRCSAAELERFLDGSRKAACGWMGFYWGKPPEELRRSGTIADALLLAWLELFQRKGKAFGAHAVFSLPGPWGHVRLTASPARRLDHVPARLPHQPPAPALGAHDLPHRRLAQARRGRPDGPDPAPGRWGG